MWFETRAVVRRKRFNFKENLNESLTSVRSASSRSEKNDEDIPFLVANCKHTFSDTFNHAKMRRTKCDQFPVSDQRTHS